MNIRNLILSLVVITLASCTNNQKNGSVSSEKNGIENLTKTTFKDKVYDYSNSSVWKFKGDKPCVIDFYATWCGPCKRIAPDLESLSKEYTGKINFYRVDVDEQKDLAMAFGVESIPTLYFCPVNGKPRIEMGLIPKENLVEIINSLLTQKN